MIILKCLILTVWVFLCAILLIFIVGFSEQWKFSVTISSSVFLIIAYGGIFLLFRKFRINHLNHYHIVMVVISILSSVCAAITFISFSVYVAMMFRIIPNEGIKFLNGSSFLNGVMGIAWVFSGGGISLILWHWIITKHLKKSSFYTIANIQMILVLTSAYAFAIGLDYMTFVRRI